MQLVGKTNFLAREINLEGKTLTYSNETYISSAI